MTGSLGPVQEVTWVVHVSHSSLPEEVLPGQSALPVSPLLLELFKGGRVATSREPELWAPASRPWSSVLCGLGTGPAHHSRTWCVLFGDFSEEGSRGVLRRGRSQAFVGVQMQ